MGGPRLLGKGHFESAAAALALQHCLIGEAHVLLPSRSSVLQTLRHELKCRGDSMKRERYEMLIAKLNSVEINSTVGKVEKSSGLVT